MVTLFTVQKPNEGHIKIIQDNALKSWRVLRPEPEILLIGDGGYKCNQYGTPLVNDIFSTAERLASNGLLCYINADIILMPDFMRVALEVARKHQRFLMVGQRWDLDITEPIDLSNGWETALLGKNGKMHGPTGTDYFLFRKGTLGTIPPFALGRPVWDNWMLWNASNLGLDIVDVTKRVIVIHQNHDYSHLRVDTIEHGWAGLETDENLRLAGGHIQFL